MSKRVMVTGASGFVGGHVVEAAVAAGMKVTCLVRATSNRARLEPLGVDFAIGDVTDPKSVAAAARETDAVIHLAALLKVPWRKTFIEENVAGAEVMCEALASLPNAPALVYISSIAASGPAPSDRAMTESDPLRPVSRYGRAKAQSEAAVARMSDRLPVTIVRPPMVFGEHDWASLPLFRMARRGWFVSPRWTPAKLSLVDARDLAQMLVAAAHNGERIPAGASLPGDGGDGTGWYYACGDEHPSFPALGRSLAVAMGARAPFVVRIPGPVTRAVSACGEIVGRFRDKPTVLNLDKAAEGLAGDWWCNAAKAKKQLGWRPAPLADGLRRTADWYLSQGWLL